MRPQIVGDGAHKIAQDREIADAMFEVLETQRMVEGTPR